MLIIIGFFSSLLIWWIKKGETKKIERTVEKSRSAGVATTLFAFTAALVSYFIQLTNWLSAPFLAYIADNVGAKRRLLVSILLITLLFQGGFFYGAELLAIGVAGVSWAGAIGGIVQITLLLIAIIKLGGMWFEKADTSRWWRVPKYCLFATMQVIVAMGFLIGFILFISFHITLTTMPLGAGGLAFAALGLILTLFWLTTIVRETIGRENPG
jgi:MFS family permease